jgi:V/A-type H+/Na+-transporting ATPase subunit C
MAGPPVRSGKKLKMSAYLNTRVSLYSGRLLRDQDLDALVRLPQADMADTLSAFGLPQLAAGFEPASAREQDLRSLEQRIIAQILDETQVLIRPLAGDERSFLIYWTGRFEISNVKTLLRGKMTGERPSILLARLTPMGPFSRIDNQELAHAEDVGELLQRLEGGTYAGIVRLARRAFEDSRDPFSLDAALDRGYYEGLIQRARPLEKSEGAPFRKLMAGLIDRINLVWLLRYRFNYGLPPAQVYYLLLASRYSLSGTLLRELAALDSLEAVLAALPTKWQEALAGAADVPAVFSRMERLTAELASQTLHSSAPGLARAFAYLILRERDLRAVRAVLRGRHLGLSDAAIRFALQRTPEMVM